MGNQAIYCWSVYQCIRQYMSNIQEQGSPETGVYDMRGDREIGKCNNTKEQIKHKLIRLATRFLFVIISNLL